MELILLFGVLAVMRVIEQVCNKLSSNEITAKKRFFAYGSLYQFTAALFSLIAIIFTGFNNFNLGLIFCSVVNAVLFAVSLFCAIEAIKGCSIAVANLFGLGGLIISVLVSYFWFGEEIKAHQLIGLGIFFVAAYLLSSKDGKFGKKLTVRTLLLLFTYFLSEGFVMVVQKYFALRVEGANTPLFSLVTFTFCGLFMLVCFLFTLRKKDDELTVKPKEEVAETRQPLLTKRLIICGTLLALALFSINIIVTEMSKTVPSIVIFPVSSAISILVATLVGYFVFKEKLSVKKIIGLVVGLASIIIIGI